MQVVPPSDPEYFNVLVKNITLTKLSTDFIGLPKGLNQDIKIP